MISPEHVAVVLLAAGSSSRFGTEDKLGQLLGNLPLGLHVARTLSSLPFAARIAVVQDQSPDFEAFGFTHVINPNPSLGQAASIRLGVCEAQRMRPQAFLIILGDMPFVTLGHVENLLRRYDRSNPIVCSTEGTRRSPPALFDASFFHDLMSLTGDTGARELLRKAALVEANCAELADIDTRDDFMRVS